jgi:hypothetical protein
MFKLASTTHDASETQRAGGSFPWYLIVSYKWIWDTKRALGQRHLAAPIPANTLPAKTATSANDTCRNA